MGVWLQKQVKVVVITGSSDSQVYKSSGQGDLLRRHLAELREGGTGVRLLRLKLAVSVASAE